MSKRKIMLMIFTLVFTVVTACSPGSPSSTAPSADSQNQPNATEKPPEKAEIRVAWFGNQARHDMMNKIMDNFQAKYPHITVLREFAATNDYWMRLTTQTAGRNAPDLFVMQFDRFENYVSKGQLLQLDDLVKSKIIDISDFDATHIKNGQSNGKTYGISLGGSIRGLFYNTKMFQDAGIALPKEDWTWNDFVNASIQLTKNLNKKGVYAVEDFGGSTDVLFTYMGSGEFDFFKDGKLGFPKSELKKYFEMMEGLRGAGAIPPPDVQAELGGKSQPESMFGKGQVAMQFKPTNQLGLYQKVTKDELNVTRIPMLTKPGDFIGSTNWVISAHSKHPKEAAMLLNYLVNDTEAIDLWRIELGPLPSKKMSDYIYPKLEAADKKLVDYTAKTLPITKPVKEFPERGNEVLSIFSGIYEKVAYKKLTIDQAVNEFFAESEKILK
jgi:multiple sugar transport system substrate-binding protein